MSYTMNKWHHELQSELCENIYDFGRIHMNIYKVTNVTKYQSFQYRLLQRVLVTNIHMYKWNMIDNNLCTFCRNAPETSVHLFIHCRVVQDLWQKVFNFISQNFILLDPMAISDADIIRNAIVKPVSNVSNFFCLVTKQYIYKQRCLKRDVNFYELNMIFRKLENIKKYIASKNNRIQIHLHKWKRIGAL